MTLVNEYSPLNTQGSVIRSYPLRWYVLTLFSLLSASQCALWISYSAVSETTQVLYNTTAANVNFLAATGPLAFIPLSSLTSWIITAYGLRATCIIGAVLCAASAVIRCFATTNTFWIVILAQFLNASAGPVVMNAPPALSAAWFRADERTFATAFGTVANSVGSAAGFFIGLLIHDARDLQKSLYYEAIFAVALLVMFIIYFPSFPPSPPSATANVQREKKPFLSSWLELMRESAMVFKSKDGVLILLIVGISSGLASGWSAMLVNILQSKYSQANIQWLGLFNIFGALVGGMAIGKFHDMYRHFKVIIVVLFLMAAVVFGGFTFVTTYHIIEVPFVVIVVLVVGVGLTLSATWPISFEALVEVTYPVKEEVSAGLLSLVNNFACLAILILGDYFTGTSINWTMTGVCFACFVFMLLVKERYLRTSIDLK